MCVHGAAGEGLWSTNKDNNNSPKTIDLASPVSLPHSRA